MPSINFNVDVEKDINNKTRPILSKAFSISDQRRSSQDTFRKEVKAQDEAEN